MKPRICNIRFISPRRPHPPYFERMGWNDEATRVVPFWHTGPVWLILEHFSSTGIVVHF